MASSVADQHAHAAKERRRSRTPRLPIRAELTAHLPESTKGALPVVASTKPRGGPKSLAASPPAAPAKPRGLPKSLAPDAATSQVSGDMPIPKAPKHVSQSQPRQSGELKSQHPQTLLSDREDSQKCARPIRFTDGSLDKSTEPAAAKSQASQLFEVLDDTCRTLRICGNSNSEQCVGGLQKLVVVINAFLLAAEVASNSFDKHTHKIKICVEACRLFIFFMRHPSLSLRIKVCDALKGIMKLLALFSIGAMDHSSRSVESSLTVKTSEQEAKDMMKDLFLASLSLLGTTSSMLRDASLELIVAIPFWDAELVGRAIKVPPLTAFQPTIVGEAEDAGIIINEKWHGALYFALDDEIPGIRIRVLRAFASVAARPELRSNAEVAGVKAMKGVFERVATVSAACLVDDNADVRQAAADSLLAIMQGTGVLFGQAVGRGVKPQKKGIDGLPITSVLQAMRVDRAAVFRVLRNAHFADAYALEAALTALLEYGIVTSSPKLSLDAPTDHSPEDENELLDLLSHLGKSHANIFVDPNSHDCPERRPMPKHCNGLGHRLFRRVLESASSESRPGVHSIKIQRIVTLLKAAAAEQRCLLWCTPELEDFSAYGRSNLLQIGSVGIQKSIVVWARQLDSCCDVIREAFHCSMSTSTFHVSSYGAHVARQRLRSITIACRRAASQIGKSTASYSMVSALRAIAAWAVLLREALQALTVLESSGLDILQSQGQPRIQVSPTHETLLFVLGEQVHAATSYLMHNFFWDAFLPENTFPQILLAFRLLGLRLLALGSPQYASDLLTMSTAFGLTSTAVGDGSTELLAKPVWAFLPKLPEGYFSALLAHDPSSIHAHDSRITSTAPVPSRPSDSSGLPQAATGCVQLHPSLGGLLNVSVQSTITRGLSLRVSMPCSGPDGMEYLQSRIPVPSNVAAADESAAAASSFANQALHVCQVPLSFPWPCESKGLHLRLELVLLVDTCANTTKDGAAARGATCIDPKRPAYRQLNELRIGSAIDLPFSALAP